VGVSQTLQRWTEGATYIRQGGHHVGYWPTFLVICVLHCVYPYYDSNTASTIATSIVHSKLNYCNSLDIKLPKSQISRHSGLRNLLSTGNTCKFKQFKYQLSQTNPRDALHHGKPTATQPYRVADISRSALYAFAVYKAISLHRAYVCVVIATKPVHRFQIRPIVHN